MQRVNERGRCSRVANASERYYGRPPDLEVCGLQLRNQDVERRRAMLHERFDDLVSQLVASHESRERAFDTGALEPPKDQRERAQVFLIGRVQRFQQVLNTGGRDLTVG